MKTIIIEDEKKSAEHLHNLIKTGFPEINVLQKLRSVEDSLHWLNNNEHPDLIFIDIELSDGTCFEILNETKTKAKLIFTTAYDQHALKAFDFNSIAYLLKPITERKLSEAIEKIDGIYPNNGNEIVVNELKKLFKQDYKKRFLVKRGEKLWHVNTCDIAYFASEDGLSLAYLFDKRKFFIDHSLDELENLLDPVDFFRINRKLYLNISCIKTVKAYFTRRLMLEIEPPYENEVIVSKERVSKFKTWLDT